MCLVTTLLTLADDRDMGCVDFESLWREDASDRLGLGVGDFPLLLARRTVQMTVVGHRSDVELLAPIGAVAVPNHAELLQHVQSAIDGGRDDARVEPPTPLDELGPGDVTARPSQHIDDGAPLWRPAEATLTQPPRKRRPRLSK